jgi:acyl-CoA synthetase (NDP forming)
MSIKFENIINPRSVAIIGASEDMGKFAGRIFGYLHKHNYTGTIYPINPKYETVRGLQCYKSVLDTPEPPDVVVMAIPTRAVLNVVTQCVQRGAGCAVIITTGFAEMNDEGKRLQKEIVKQAQEGGLRIWGPNCMGMVNPMDGVALSSTYTQNVSELIPGSIGMVSQSGGLFAAIFNRANDDKIGLRAACSIGNEADIDTSEILEYYLNDEKTKVMVAYSEGIRNPERFRSVAEKALFAGKPIIIYKVGSSEQGVKAALSHTASMAGSDQSFNDFCRQYGIIRVYELEALLPTANLFASYGIASGDQLAVITGSGGHAGIIPDRSEFFGLKLSEYSPETREFLHGIIGDSQSVNPADLAVIPLDGLYQKCVETIGADRNVDAILFAYATTPDWEKCMSYLIDYGKKINKPAFFYTLVGSLAGDIPQKAREAGIPFFWNLDACLRSIRDWIWYAKVREKRIREWEKNALSTAGRPEALPDIHFPRKNWLSEFEVKDILDTLGIQTPKRNLAFTIEEAEKAADKLGYPVVMKVVAKELAHKSDIGGVHLNLRDANMVRIAYEKIMKTVQASAPHAKIECVLVEQMIPSGHEIIIGAKKDPLFGSQIMIGAGGIFAEILNKKATRFLPLTVEDIEEMIQEANLDKILSGVRTGKPLDKETLIQTVLKLAAFIEHYSDKVLELDINPLVVLSAGEGVYAVDSFMVFS